MLPSWWRSNFLSIELGIGIAGAAGLAVWGSFFDGDRIMEEVLSQNRGAIYGTIASLSGSMLGFVITTQAVILTFSSSGRLALLRESRHYPTLWHVFTSSIHALALATVLALLALFFDREWRPVSALQYAVGGSMVLTALRIIRTVWILEQVIILLTGSGQSRTSDDP